MTVRFQGGKNIAMKVPPHQFEATVRFYRDVLSFEQIAGPAGYSVGFRFGSNNLWIDTVAGLSQAVARDRYRQYGRRGTDAGECGSCTL